MKAVFLVSAVSIATLVACGPVLSRQTIRVHEELGLDALEPKVIEASAPIPPRWLGQTDRRAAGRIGFVGYSTARTLDAAKAQAMRDLLSSVSSFISVDVQTEHLDLSVQSASGRTIHQRNHVRSEVRTRSSAKLRGLRPDAFYWEKNASALTPDSGNFAYHLHAWVPRQEIVRARIEKTSWRERRTGKRTVALLPFRPTFVAGPKGAGVLGRGLVEELGHRLGASGALRVADPSVVRSLLPANAGQLSALELREQIADALLPDVLIGGVFQRDGDGIRITVTVYDGSGGRGLGSRSVSGRYADLFDLQASLATALQGDLRSTPTVLTSSTARTNVEAKESDLEAFEAYHEAYDLFARGANQEALDRIERAIELRPEDARAHLRIGRILERMGRYGRLPPKTGTASAREDTLVVCTGAGKAAVGRARQFLSDRADELERGSSPAGTKPWWTEQTPEVDPILHRVSRQRWDGADAPVPGKIPTAAIEGYWLALHLARLAEDRQTEMNALLALADLAVRVDRIDPALRLYTDVRKRAKRDRDPHFESLALFGKAVAHRKDGALPSAKSLLRLALVVRATLADKPYLLEILNELGGVSVELGEYSKANEYYGKAWRIAAALGSDYLRSVLSNNVGVLEFHEGHVADADERFSQAYDQLSNLGEAEGKVASGLNLSFVSAFRGDAGTAEKTLDEVAHVVATTTQEGRLAELSAHQGSFATLQGQATEGLYELGKSWLLFSRLQRTVQATRQRSSLYAAEFYEAGTSEDELECLKEQYWALDAPVFEARSGQRRVTTVADVPPGSLQVHDLVVALSGASVAALSGWTPAHVRPARTAKWNYGWPSGRRRSTWLDALRQSEIGYGMLTRSTEDSLRRRALAMSPSRRRAEADKWLQLMQLTQAHVREMVAEARREKDVVKLNCLNDKLAAIVALVEVAERAMQDLSQAMKRGAEDAALHELTKLSIAIEKMIHLRDEADRCIGRLMLYTGDAVVLIEEQEGARLPEPADLPPLQGDKPAEYERILGAFTVDPDIVALLDPLVCDERLSSRAATSARRMLAGLVDHFEVAGLPRFQAAARLNLAALLWFDNEPEPAYRHLMRAHGIYAELGDVHGLAHAYEWLGYFFMQSGALPLAGQHLGVARELYGLVGNEPAAARVLGYARAP